MSEYWRSYFDSNSRAFPDSLLKQVGRTLNGQEVSEEQVNLAVASIRGALQLGPHDRLLDLCCGNGLITRRLAPHVSEIMGVDFSTGLIEAAVRLNSPPNARYINADVLGLPGGTFRPFDKVVMYEALQHFSEEQLSALLDALGEMAAGSLVFFGGMPDRNQLRAYYDTGEKFDFYQRREHEGRPHMGRWWLADEIRKPAERHGFEFTLLAQAPPMYKSHYCFDVLLEKRA